MGMPPGSTGGSLGYSFLVSIDLNQDHALSASAPPDNLARERSASDRLMQRPLAIVRVPPACRIVRHGGRGAGRAYIRTTNPR